MARTLFGKKQMKDSVTATITSVAGWQYVALPAGLKRIEIEAHYVSGTNTNGPIIQFGFNSTNTGTPPANHYANDHFFANNATVGRDLGAAQVYFARSYQNALGVIHSYLRASADQSNAFWHGAGMVAQNYESMQGMAANNFGSNWLAQGYLGIYTSVAGALTYTIKYYF